MNCEGLRTVEIVWELSLWDRTRPIPSVHRDLGYVTYESPDRIHIAPELTYSFENRLLRVKHEQKIVKQSAPVPTIFPLEESPEETSIIQIDYEDPFHWEGIRSADEVKSLKHSTLRLVGFLVHEDKRYFWMGLATYEYVDGQIDYVTPHLIPKSSVLKRTFFKRKNEQR